MNKNNRFNQGVTIVELLVSLMLLSIISTIATQLLISSQRSLSAVEMINTLKTQDQKGMNEISREISTAKVFISKNPLDSITDTYSKFYLDRLRIKTQNIFYPTEVGNSKFQSINSSRLPVTLEDLSFNKDSGKKDQTSIDKFDPTAVGNSLMLGSPDDSITYNWTQSIPDPPNPNKIVNRSRILDVLNLKYYYLAKFLNDSSSSNMLGLILWTSGDFIDYYQLQKLLNDLPTNSDRDVCLNWIKNTTNPPKSDSRKKRDIVAIGAWKYSEKSKPSIVGTSYIYKLERSGVTQNLLAVDNSYVIESKSVEYVTRDKILMGTKYGISKNIDSSSAANGSMVVPKFGVFSNTGDGFPNGFEVMISGAAGGRIVFARSLSVSNNQGKKFYNETTITATGNDS